MDAIVVKVIVIVYFPHKLVATELSLLLAAQQSKL
jgi:hypothetical protein